MLGLCSPSCVAVLGLDGHEDGRIERTLSEQEGLIDSRVTVIDLYTANNVGYFLAIWF